MATSLFCAFQKMRALTSLALVALALSACSQSPSWVSPSSWFGSSDDTLAQRPAKAQPAAKSAKDAEIEAQRQQAARKNLMPPPDASPVPRVEAQELATRVLPPLTGKSAPIPAVGRVAPEVAKRKAAILLPLSGPHASLGQTMLNAAQQAVFDTEATGFELMPRDTGSGGEKAELAAKDAIANGAQILIGPLFAANVPAVRAIAQQANLNVLALSSDASKAERGVYIMGFSPKEQVERIIAFAATKGLRRFAALLPRDSYGELVGNVFREAVARNGGTIAAIETCDFKAAHAQSSAPLPCLNALTAKRGQFDALLLPEGGDDLTLLANRLAAMGLGPDHVKPLGTGLWDVPGLGLRIPALVGGWYAATDPAARRDFVASYQRAYGQEPSRLATLAYDTTAMAAVLARRGAAYDAYALTNPGGFSGLDGIFRLRPNGLVERGLAVLEVTPSTPSILDAAPASFATRREM
ncbi:MAG: penicillin-binding protein activator [Bdellovibrionales bacterium]